MVGTMEIDTERIDEAVLALLYLGLHDGQRGTHPVEAALYQR